MPSSIASFRDLKGVGPATEARLHDAGIYTWDALATAASALAAVRDCGTTPREVADAVAARGAEADDRMSPHLSDGEHVEAFVVRLALDADHEPRRCTATHVRTSTDQGWPGWAPTQLVRFIEEQSDLAGGAPDPDADPRTSDGDPPSADAPSADAPRPTGRQVVALDAGLTIGGPGRDVVLVLTGADTAGHDFRYQATLLARPLGAADEESWSVVARRAGTGASGDDLALGFAGAELPRGLCRLRLRADIELSTPIGRSLELAVAQRPGTP